MTIDNLMCEDFDYVSMGNYEKDTRELVETSAAMLAEKTREIAQLRMLINLLIEAAGKIEIPRHKFESGVTKEIVIEYRADLNSMMYEAL